MLCSDLVRKSTLLLHGMGHVESGTTESCNDDRPVVEDDLDESTIDSISMEVPLDGNHVANPSCCGQMKLHTPRKDWVARNRIPPLVSLNGIHSPLPTITGMYYPPEHTSFLLENQVNFFESLDLPGTGNDSSDESSGLDYFAVSDGPRESDHHDTENSDNSNDSNDSDDSEEPSTAAGVLSTNFLAGDIDELHTAAYATHNVVVSNIEQSMDERSDSEDARSRHDKFMDNFRVFQRETLETEGNIRQILRTAWDQNLYKILDDFSADLRRTRRRRVRAPLRDQLNDVDLFSNSTA
jgi:hypothetical protein